MTVHHQQNHHVAALSGVAVANNGLNLSRMSGLEAHRLENMVDRNGIGIERLSNGLDSRNNNLNNNNNNLNNNDNNNGLERGDASTTMPQRSRFMITDILGGASSKMHQSGLPSQEPPGSPPSTPRDLSVRHQSRTSLSTSNLDEDSDASHHDGASVTSNVEKGVKKSVFLHARISFLGRVCESFVIRLRSRHSSPRIHIVVISVSWVSGKFCQKPFHALTDELADFSTRN